MNDDYFSETLRDLVEIKYIIIAIISAIIIEYFMVIGDVFVNFPSISSSIQLYLVISIIMIAVYHAIWRVEYIRIFNIMFRSMFFILPIGVFWAYYQGYATETLLNLEWLLTHDMVYTVLASQIVAVLIMMLGLKDYLVVRN